MASFQLHHSRHANLQSKILPIRSAKENPVLSPILSFTSNSENKILLIVPNRIWCCSTDLELAAWLRNSALYLNFSIWIVSYFFSSWLNTKSIKLVGRKASGQGHAVQKIETF